MGGGLVLLMHRGYAFVLVRAGDTRLPDPPVWFYTEGGNGPERRWETFSDFLDGLAAERRAAAATDRDLGRT